MSYETQAQLRTDDMFNQRVTSCLNEQAFVFKDDTRQDMAALADAQLKGGGPSGTWMAIVCGSPGIKDAADQASVTDGDLLAVVQSQWPVVAALTFPSS